MMSGRPDRGFLARLLVAAATGQTKESFAEQEYKLLACSWCRDGSMPLNDNGDHELLGVIVPCDAKQPQPAVQ